MHLYCCVVMSMQVLPHSSAAYRPEAIWNARRAFFGTGESPTGLIDDAVVRSWQRCSQSGRQENEPIEFQPVDRSRIQQLLDANGELLAAARPELFDLASSVASAGYAVLLTDRHGNALAVDGAIAQRSHPLRAAFRAGVDLSEGAIGTNAMAVALREAQPVRVLGAEHFYTDAQIFHCSAVPVLDAHGNVIGALDVSRDMPGMVGSAMWVAARCAQRIERRLFCDVDAQVRVEIDVGGQHVHGSGAWLAFAAGGRLAAANRSARRLLGLPLGELQLGFEQLFEERFGPWMTDLRRSASGAPLRLHDGVHLRAVAFGDGHQASVAVNAHRPAPAAAAARPAFGDIRIDRDFDRALKTARAGLPVLITGETGSGKEVTARALHAASERAKGPFVALNCAAVPGELLAGELFGHVDGAFTGSRKEGAAGKFEAAHGGTLFLDELGDMPLGLQAALLRVLDTREVIRLGCHRSRPVDVRIVCATHRDLPLQVRSGLFREDLFYRVSGYNLHLLPLRERTNFDSVLDALVSTLGGHPHQLGPELRARLRAHAWPGNVRQLSHALLRALALADQGAALHGGDFELDTMPSPARGSAPASEGLLKRVTDSAIEEALRRANGNVTAAARMLGMGRATLYRRLKRP